MKICKKYAIKIMKICKKYAVKIMKICKKYARIFYSFKIYNSTYKNELLKYLIQKNLGNFLNLLYF
jgi:hypothetical protein